MFFDPRLSSTGTVSCASCHVPGNYFTDPRGASIGVSGVTLPRKAPTILNRAFSTQQMWDGAGASLETQVQLPLFHAAEMGLSPGQLAALLTDIPSYSSALTTSLGGQIVTTQNAAGLFGTAMASFERSLTSANSRVDQYQSLLAQPGSASALSALLSLQETQGMALFFGKARCVACHSNSNYTDESFHRSILPPSPTDLGLQDVTSSANDVGKFKTPSLRNLGSRSRFFHNGSSTTTTLAQVVALYNSGPKYNATAPPDPELRPLSLSTAEQSALVAFLQALTSTDPLPTPPTTSLPALSSTTPRQQVVLPSGTVVTRSCDLNAIGLGDSTAVTNQVAYLYCLQLGRAPDPLALSTMPILLQLTPLPDVMDGFFIGSEFNSTWHVSAMSNSDFVTFLYRLLYGQEPSATQLSAYNGALTAGSPRQAVFDYLIRFPPFAARNAILSSLLQRGLPVGTSPVPLGIV